MTHSPPKEESCSEGGLNSGAVRNNPTGPAALAFPSALHPPETARLKLTLGNCQDGGMHTPTQTGLNRA